MQDIILLAHILSHFYFPTIQFIACIKSLFLFSAHVVDTINLSTMFIKKIILDGFKSYGRRVELTGFDQSFNAITGFNGSGKSNILDAICFVLGLNKLEVARCHSLNDLIYKNGQAHVQTATVIIEIDNSDRKFTHTDYINTKTICVRRDVSPFTNYIFLCFSHVLSF